MSIFKWTTEPKKIIYWEPIIVSDMQWPCPDGFHVPTRDESSSMYSILKALWLQSSTRYTYLKMPLAWDLYWENWTRKNSGSQAFYRTSSIYDSSDSRYINFSTWTTRVSKYTGCSIRPFKNTAVIPTSSWDILYDWSSAASWAGVFHNATDGLISLSSDWTNWITIADKNLWATTVWNNGDTLSKANCGGFFQRWNNYMFPRSWATTTDATAVNAWSYWPWNYYSSSTFITTNPRDSSDNANLWWWVTQWTTEKSKEVKAVYLWENKVRPEWKREPNANTVAYRPLNSTTTNTDQSWNGYNLRQTWGSFTTLDGVDCFYNGWSTTGYFNLTSASKIPSWNADRTILLRANSKSYSSSYDRAILQYGSNANGSQLTIALSTSNNAAALTYNYAVTWDTMTSWKWVSLAFTYSWGTWKFYQDGVLKWSANTSLSTTAISSSYPLRLMRRNTSTSSNYQFRWYLSEVIIEDKAWTADEVLAYYNQTKWNYE